MMGIGIYRYNKPSQQVLPHSSVGRDEEAPVAAHATAPATAPAAAPVAAHAIVDTAAELTDVFLTHDWGKDEEGRDNHARVCKHAKVYTDGMPLHFFTCLLNLNSIVARILAPPLSIDRNITNR